MSDMSYDTPLFNGRCPFLFERTAGRNRFYSFLDVLEMYHM
jgi:hypothetical protein